MSLRDSSDGPGDGLFHEDVLAVFRGEARVFEVEIVGGDEVHGVDAGIARGIPV